jgi:hypothetical protein
MDPPDVEMEPAEQPPSHPQQPPPQQQPAAAAGDGWSMLSRARGLLEEGQPSLALQAVRTLAPLPLPSHPLSRSASISCVSSRLDPRRVCLGAGNSPGCRHASYPSEVDHSIGTNAVVLCRFNFVLDILFRGVIHLRISLGEEMRFRWGDSF